MSLDVKPAFYAAAAIFISLTGIACSGGSAAGSGGYGNGDPNLAASNPGGGPISPFLADGQAVLRALDAVETRSGKPLRVTSITSDRSNGLMVEVQEPAHPINVDAYTVAPNGTLSGPAPVKLMSLSGGPITVKDVDDEAFDPRAVGFGHLAATAREAIAKSNYSDARVSEWDFAGIHPDDRRFMYLDSARARPAAELGPHLNVVAVRY